MPIIKVYHFHNGTGGGVLSVIQNLLQFSVNSQIENHVIFTINKNIVNQYEMPVLNNAASQQVFYYRPYWNFYYTCRQLNKLLPDANAIIVAHDWLELGMASLLGLQNPVVQFLHGNYAYYYNTAATNASAIDRFICISPAIYSRLCKVLPARYTAISFARFPVPEVPAGIKPAGVLQLFFCVGNLKDYNKQFELLPAINTALTKANISVQWTVVGHGYSTTTMNDLLAPNKVVYYSDLPNQAVLSMMKEQHLLLLPSLKEGLPVVLVEAMKAGMVPLISNWEEATAGLVTEGETGFYCKPGDAAGYSEKIAALNNNRPLLATMAANASKKANELFGPYHNTKIIESVFIEMAGTDRLQKKLFKAYGSRLDRSWLPNWLVSKLRRG